MDAAKARKYDHFIQRLEQLPALPHIVLELAKAIDDPMSSIKEIENMMLRDPGLTLKALKIANSAYYSIPGGAKTLSRAITFLGMNTLKQLVLSAAVFDSLKTESNPHFDVMQFWRHSVGTAIASQTIAHHLGFPPPDELFICGLVHDMGKIVINIIDPDEFSNLCKYATQNNLTTSEAELKIESQRHTYWGHVLAHKWRLPIMVQSAIKDHHSTRPSLRLSQDREVVMAVDIVYVANNLMHQIAFGHSGHATVRELDEEVTKRIGLGAEKMESLIKKVQSDLNSVDSFVEALNG